MDYRLLLSIESILFIGAFLVSIYLFIPKSVQFWRQWKESKKTIYLSNAIASGVVAIFLLIGDLLLFVKAIGNAHA